MDIDLENNCAASFGAILGSGCSSYSYSYSYSASRYSYSSAALYSALDSETASVRAIGNVQRNRLGGAKPLVARTTMKADKIPRDGER
ncbi:hypothetical protein Rcae01_00073 [Novipirellula caenicola]|uniref:Uncharacterized protein n=1 Tax=Novipirellula caenicola TaxID=1536901 RepID=A0ABP9VHD6_9BACT